MLSDGYSDVPAGKIAAVVTHLEMFARPTPKPVQPHMARLVPHAVPDPSWYRDLFRRVGGLEWLWFSRLGMNDSALKAILNQPDVHVYSVQIDGHDEGLLELDFRESGACELAYFGLTSAQVGRGLGRWLMEQALDLAWAENITRFHVHTCTLDSPQALDFYVRSGFTPYRRQLEIADDPRLTGQLPRSAAPHIPIL